MRYDLSKLRAKGLVEKQPRSRRYRLLAVGYKIAVVYLKLFERIYAPLAAGILGSFTGHTSVPKTRLGKLDKLYSAVVEALDNLLEVVGLKTAA